MRKNKQEVSISACMRQLMTRVDTLGQFSNQEKNSTKLRGCKGDITDEDLQADEDNEVS